MTPQRQRWARNNWAPRIATRETPPLLLGHRHCERWRRNRRRVLSSNDDLVSLRWRDYAHGGKKKVLRLTATDLLGRFLLHVLPRGFQRVRHYGLLGNRQKAVKLAACRRYFGTVTTRNTDAPRAIRTTAALLSRLGIHPDRCPACGSRRVRREPLSPTAIIPRARAPTVTA